MFWRHWSLASRPCRPSVSNSLSSSSDRRDKDGGGGGIDDTGEVERKKKTDILTKENRTALKCSEPWDKATE